jgi:hypothetical protein
MSRSDDGVNYRKEKRRKEVLRLRKRAQKKKRHASESPQSSTSVG